MLSQIFRSNAFWGIIGTISLVIAALDFSSISQQETVSQIDVYVFVGFLISGLFLVASNAYKYVQLEAQVKQLQLELDQIEMVLKSK